MPDFNPELDLRIERTVAATPEMIWRYWTEPDLFRQWFTPPPVTVEEVDIDLTPGGRFFSTMKLPDGTLMPTEGCFVFVEPLRRHVFTDALRAGFRPASAPFFTADVRLIPTDTGTLYAVHVMHADAEARQKHEEMAFTMAGAPRLASLPRWPNRFDQLKGICHFIKQFLKHLQPAAASAPLRGGLARAFLSGDFRAGLYAASGLAGVGRP